MENLFKHELFTKAIKDKIFNEMGKRKERISLENFADEIGISKATLSRVFNGKVCDLETYFRLCFWMKRSANEFYKH